MMRDEQKVMNKLNRQMFMNTLHLTWMGIRGPLILIDINLENVWQEYINVNKSDWKVFCL